MSRMLESLLLNMVAGKGSKRNGPPEFSETNFYGSFLFMKAHLGRFRGADDALEQEYPTTLADENGEEFDCLSRSQERELEILQEKCKLKNWVCSKAITDACFKNLNARRVA
jgi:hypothetical protein